MNEEIEFAGYNVTKSLRIDELDAKRLEKIALYERVRIGTLLRMWVHDKILTYYRNPQFRRWLKQASLISIKETKRK